MSTIRALDLAHVDKLGPRGRSCIYWQTDSAVAGRMAAGDGAPGGGDTGGGPPGADDAAGAADEPSASDPEFEKEAWISRVSLEWGVCGQLAQDGDRAIGSAFYAPPGMIPRADSFPTSPAGSDAILLAGLIEEEDAPAGVRTALLAEVVNDLRARGIKAIESFGLTSGDPTSGDPASLPSRDGCGAEFCITDTGFLIEHGFTVVAEHESIPRLRLDIESEHQWKADVEYALDQLFAEHGFPTRRMGVLSGATVRAQSR